jgi:predicted phage baseplate assembly protein
MLPLGEESIVESQREDDAGWEPWQQVEDFSKSSFEDKHFICDSATGEIQFGPIVRSSNGDEVRYGATPFGGSQVRLSSYLNGGGPRGNVGTNTLRVLKTSIPYIASVTNRRPAGGGVDPENIDALKMRGPQLLRTRERAVTSEDFEFLAKEASPLVGRAKCVPVRETGEEGNPAPGVIQLLLAPIITSPQRRTTPEELKLPRELLEEIKDYLDDRRLLTTTLMVLEPEYVWVSVAARIKIRSGASIDETQQAVEDQLYRYIHPISGGTDKEGWPFGRDLFVSELYSQIQVVPDVEYVEELLVYPVNPVSGVRGEATQSLSLSSAALLCSHLHEIDCH